MGQKCILKIDDKSTLIMRGGEKIESITHDRLYPFGSRRTKLGSSWTF